MKAEYRPKTPIFENHLTLGKLYTVIDTKCTGGRSYGEVAEIKIKDNSGKKHWYKADLFIFYAEAAATITKPAGMSAAAGAAMPATGAPQSITIKAPPPIMPCSPEEVAKMVQNAARKRKGGLIYGA